MCLGYYGCGFGINGETHVNVIDIDVLVHESWRECVAYLNFADHRSKTMKECRNGSYCEQEPQGLCPFAHKHDDVSAANFIWYVGLKYGYCFGVIAQAEQCLMLREAEKATHIAEVAAAEAVRLAAEAEAEAVRIAAEAEAVRLAAEAEAVRLAAEAEAEAVRIAAEAKAAQRAKVIKAVEAARHAVKQLAEAEVLRLAAKVIKDNAAETANLRAEILKLCNGDKHVTSIMFLPCKKGSACIGESDPVKCLFHHSTHGDVSVASAKVKLSRVVAFVAAKASKNAGGPDTRNLQHLPEDCKILVNTLIDEQCSSCGHTHGNCFKDHHENQNTEKQRFQIAYDWVLSVLKNVNHPLHQQFHAAINGIKPYERKHNHDATEASPPALLSKSDILQADIEDCKKKILALTAAREAARVLEDALARMADLDLEEEASLKAENAVDVPVVAPVVVDVAVRRKLAWCFKAPKKGDITFVPSYLENDTAQASPVASRHVASASEVIRIVPAVSRQSTSSSEAIRKVPVAPVVLWSDFLDD